MTKANKGRELNATGEIIKIGDIMIAIPNGVDKSEIIEFLESSPSDKWDKVRMAKELANFIERTLASRGIHCTAAGTLVPKGKIKEHLEDFKARVNSNPNIYMGELEILDNIISKMADGEVRKGMAEALTNAEYPAGVKLQTIMEAAERGLAMTLRVYTEPVVIANEIVRLVGLPSNRGLTTATIMKNIGKQRLALNKAIIQLGTRLGKILVLDSCEPVLGRCAQSLVNYQSLGWVLTEAVGDKLPKDLVDALCEPWYAAFNADADAVAEKYGGEKCSCGCKCSEHKAEEESTEDDEAGVDIDESVEEAIEYLDSLNEDIDGSIQRLLEVKDELIELMDKRHALAKEVKELEEKAAKLKGDN